MRLSHSIFVSMAALLLFTAGGSYAASTSQDVDVTVVNNTQARGRGDIGRLNVACGSMDDLLSGSRHLIENGATLDTSCTVEDDESLVLSYVGIGYRGTITIDCGLGERPDFMDDSTVTLTFSGSGSSVTFTQSCSGLG